LFTSEIKMSNSFLSRRKDGLADLPKQKNMPEGIHPKVLPVVGANQVTDFTVFAV
jgi:hypothetical protein